MALSGRFRVWLSNDGVNWGAAPVAEGNLSDFGTGTAERTVYFTNLARGKGGAASSTYGGLPAPRLRPAVDGNSNGDFNAASVTHTNADLNSWWEVDLASMNRISLVRLWNRTDCCSDRLSNFYVFVSDTSMVGRTLADLVADSSVKRC